MKEKEIKAQIKSIFESENFESATIKSEELFKQLEELKGKRSVSALKASLKKQYQGTVRVEKEEDLELVEPAPDSEQPVEEQPETQEPEVKEVAEQPEPFKFNVSTDGKFVQQFIEELIASNDPILNQFCIVREYFKQDSDTLTVRSTRMFVKEDGTGYDKYDDGSAAAKAAGLKSFRTLGYFDKSEDGFPVGEEYCQIQVIRIKRALEKYYISRSGITRLASAESVTNYQK